MSSSLDLKKLAEDIGNFKRTLKYFDGSCGRIKMLREDLYRLTTYQEIQRNAGNRITELSNLIDLAERQNESIKNKIMGRFAKKDPNILTQIRNSGESIENYYEKYFHSLKANWNVDREKLLYLIRRYEKAVEEMKKGESEEVGGPRGNYLEGSEFNQILLNLGEILPDLFLDDAYHDAKLDFYKFEISGDSKMFLKKAVGYLNILIGKIKVDYKIFDREGVGMPKKMVDIPLDAKNLNRELITTRDDVRVENQIWKNVRPGITTVENILKNLTDFEQEYTNISSLAKMLEDRYKGNDERVMEPYEKKLIVSMLNEIEGKIKVMEKKLEGDEFIRSQLGN